MAAAMENLDEAVEISDGIFWVGTGSKSFLNRNSYLRLFNGGGQNAAMLMDPGPTSDFDTVVAKVVSAAGDIAKVNMLFVNHQDPDVVGSLPLLAKLNPHALFLGSEDTWRLVSLNGLQGRDFRPVERFRNMRISLPSGHRLQFIPTPFCHFRGACMVYDLESRILFTGDLFGGIAASGLWADATNWAGIKAFHQLYMPSNDAIRLAVRRIRALDPQPIMLAPQHGGLIQGDLIGDFLDRMEQLQVGLDIIISLNDKLPALIAALNEIIAAVRAVLGEEPTRTVMGYFQPDGSYPAFFALSKEGTVMDIKGDAMESVESLIRAFFRHADAPQKSILKARILRMLLDHNLPPFDMLLEQEGGVAVELLEEVRED